MLVTAKWCPRCSAYLPVDEFSPDRSKSDGYASKCRGCDAAMSAEYRRRNLDRERARQQDYRRRARENRRNSADFG